MNQTGVNDVRSCLIRAIYTLTSRLTLHCFERGGVLKVLDHMLEHGDVDELHRTIQRHGRQINRIQGLRPRARRH